MAIANAAVRSIFCELVATGHYPGRVINWTGERRVCQYTPYFHMKGFGTKHAILVTNQAATDIPVCERARLVVSGRRRGLSICKSAIALIWHLVCRRVLRGHIRVVTYRIRFLNLSR